MPDSAKSPNADPDRDTADTKPQSENAAANGHWLHDGAGPLRYVPPKTSPDLHKEAPDEPQPKG